MTHTVGVTAATLYEAVVQGLAAIRGNDWVAGVAQGLNVVKSVGGGRACGARREADGTYKMESTSRSKQRAGSPFPGQDFPWPRWPRYEQETVGLPHSCALRSEPVYNVSVQGL